MRVRKDWREIGRTFGVKDVEMSKGVELFCKLGAFSV